MDKEDYFPSQEETADKIHRVIRTAIGISPIASGAILEGFNLLWKPPAESRAEQWMTDIIEALNKLAKRQSDIESLITGEEFQSLLISANQLILKHHQPEKIEYFKNSVINGITNQSIIFDKKVAFVSLLDELTISHIRAMRLLIDGILWGVDKETTESRYPYFVAKKLFELSPVLSGERQFVEKIVKDLSQHNLFHDIQLVLAKGVDVVRMGSITNTDVGIVGLEIPFSDLPNNKFVYQTRLNGFGIEFLNYITEINFDVTV